MAIGDCIPDLMYGRIFLGPQGGEQGGIPAGHGGGFLIPNQQILQTCTNCLSVGD